MRVRGGEAWRRHDVTCLGSNGIVLGNRLQNKLHIASVVDGIFSTVDSLL